MHLVARQWHCQRGQLPSATLPQESYLSGLIAQQDANLRPCGLCCRQKARQGIVAQSSAGDRTDRVTAKYPGNLHYRWYNSSLCKYGTIVQPLQNHRYQISAMTNIKKVDTAFTYLSLDVNATSHSPIQSAHNCSACCSTVFTASSCRSIELTLRDHRKPNARRRS